MTTIDKLLALLLVAFGIVLAVALLEKDEYLATTVTQEEMDEALFHFDRLLVPVTPQNARELVFPRDDRSYKSIAVEICHGTDSGCPHSREQLAVAAVKMRNGSLLGMRRTQDIAFYWLDPNDRATVDALTQACTQPVTGPAPLGLTMCAYLDQIRHWQGYGFEFYRLEAPFSTHGGGLISGSEPMEWRSLSSVLYDIRLWSLEK